MGLNWHLCQSNLAPHPLPPKPYKKYSYLVTKLIKLKLRIHCGMDQCGNTSLKNEYKNVSFVIWYCNFKLK
jgi:hypothetical protein